MRAGNKAVHSCDATGGAPRTWQLPEHIGSLALRKGGGTVVALGDGFYTLNFDTGTSTKLVDPDPGKQRIRLNHGKVDRQGRFVAGYMDHEEEREPLSNVLRLSINLPSHGSTAALSARTARAAVPMARPSISPASTSVYEGKLALRARWHVGPHGRPAGGERDERHIRRPPSRHRLRHLDGTRREASPPTRAGWGLFAVYGLGVRGIPEPRFRG